MPFSPCCKRKYSKPCKCSSPCNNCECIVQTGQCPPPTSTTEESDAASVQLYTPVIAAKPVSKKCCCCDVKPKKSFWQQLFGDRKCCCSPSQKKKQEPGCLCKQKKKQRCVPECTNLLCCNDNRPSPPPASKSCRPLCCCKKVKTCKCKTSSKPCCPTPGSLFGCHFYCNVENRENRTKQLRCRCCCCCCAKRSICETTDVTTEDEKVIKSSPCKTKGTPRFAKAEGEKKKQNVDKPTHSNYHIGLTFTNTETKYYNTNGGECPPIEEGTHYNKNEKEGLSGSSEQIITVEIHQSDGNIDQDKIDSRENSQSRIEETSSMNSSKRRKLSKVREENEKYDRRSESYSREILPVMERKSRENRNTKEIASIGSDQRRREKRASINHSVRLEDSALDKRVSEILRRLRTIENKINVIDTKKREEQKFKIDIDSNSTISFHIKDGKQYNNNNYNGNNNGKRSSKADAVIEIRKTRSKSYSPDRKHSATQISKHRYSRSLDRGSRAQRDKPKLIIKLPHGNKVSQGFVSTSSNNRVKHLSRDYQDTEWMEVSDELKNTKPINLSCYCYECVCKRVRCR